MPELWPSRTSYWKVITVIAHLSNNYVCNNHQTEADRGNVWWHDTSCSYMNICVFKVHFFFLVIKQTKCTNFSNLFWKETLLCCILILLASCEQTCMTYTIAVCTVKKLLMMDRGTARNM